MWPFAVSVNPLTVKIPKSKFRDQWENIEKLDKIRKYCLNSIDVKGNKARERDRERTCGWRILAPETVPPIGISGFGIDGSYTHTFAFVFLFLLQFLWSLFAFLQFLWGSHVEAEIFSTDRLMGKFVPMYFCNKEISLYLKRKIKQIFPENGLTRESEGK